MKGKKSGRSAAAGVFDPNTMETGHRAGNDVPAWFLDTDYNAQCFHVDPAFFPPPSAWENLKRSLRQSTKSRSGIICPALPAHRSRPRKQRKVAVKVLDDRGNEPMVVKDVVNHCHLDSYHSIDA